MRTISKCFLMLGVLMSTLVCTRLTAADYVLDFAFGSTGSGDGEFSLPSGVAIDSSGRIIVTDLNNDRVQVFNSYGVFQFAFGSYGHGDSQFYNPWDVAVDSTDNIIVSDYNNNRLQIFDHNGTFMSELSSPEFRTPDLSRNQR